MPVTVKHQIHMGGENIKHKVLYILKLQCLSLGASHASAVPRYEIKSIIITIIILLWTATPKLARRIAKAVLFLASSNVAVVRG